jgi:hypothetical protein
MAIPPVIPRVFRLAIIAGLYRPSEPVYLQTNGNAPELSHGEKLGLVKGKRGVILGVANNRSIAWRIAKGRAMPRVRKSHWPDRAMP